MKNGTTGTGDYWSANFSDVFMRANILMNKETYGGTLAIKAGNYSVTNTLVFGQPQYDRTKPTMLRMARGTWLVFADNANCGVLSDYYSFYGNGSEPCAVMASGGNIDGNRAHDTLGNGIRTSTAYGSIENVNIFHMAEKGIWLYSPHSATGTRVSDVKVINCTYGIYSSWAPRNSFCSIRIIIFACRL